MSELPGQAAELALLGKQVVVELSHEDKDPDRLVLGQFLGFGEGGDFQILCEDGMVHHCWPLLSIREVPKCPNCDESLIWPRTPHPDWKWVCQPCGLLFSEHPETDEHWGDARA